MLVAYVGRNEVIVCDINREEELLNEYFFKEGGRDLQDYDRETSYGIFAFSQRFAVQWK